MQLRAGATAPFSPLGLPSIAEISAGHRGTGPSGTAQMSQLMWVPPSSKGGWAAASGKTSWALVKFLLRPQTHPSCHRRPDAYWLSICLGGRPALALTRSVTWESFLTSLCLSFSVPGLWRRGVTPWGEWSRVPMQRWGLCHLRLGRCSTSLVIREMQPRP